jgi:hypothetical protein
VGIYGYIRRISDPRATLSCRSAAELAPWTESRTPDAGAKCLQARRSPRGCHGEGDLVRALHRLANIQMTLHRLCPPAAGLNAVTCADVALHQESWNHPLPSRLTLPLHTSSPSLRCSCGPPMGRPNSQGLKSRRKLLCSADAFRSVASHRSSRCAASPRFSPTAIYASKKTEPVVIPTLAWGAGGAGRRRETASQRIAYTQRDERVTV